MKSSTSRFVELPSTLNNPDVELEEVCPLLGEILKFFEKWSPESYEGYHLACALVLLSIVSAGRVEYLFGKRRATNLYIVLVDSSGMSAKTTVMNLVRDVIIALGLDYLLIPDTITAQKLFSSMCLIVPSEFEEKSKEEKMKINAFIQKNQAFIGQRGWIFDEFGSLMREMMQSSHYNSSFRETLKKLYDNRTKLTNSTHARDAEIIYLPFLSLLGGMTPDDLSPYAKKGSALWGDGFLPRFQFICPPKDFRKDKRFPQGEKIISESIIGQLQDWNKRLGVPQIQLSPKINIFPASGQLFEITEEVENAVYAYRYALKDLMQGFSDGDLKGSYLRYPETALSLAALFASVNNENQIALVHWSLAQNITEQWRKSLHQLYSSFLSQNKSADSSYHVDPLGKILEIVAEKGPITSREIQQLSHYKKDTVGLLLEQLLRQGKIQRFPSGKTVMYEKYRDPKL